MTAEKIIKLFALKPLPGEGGYYTETYRSIEKIKDLPERYKGDRNFSTAILYLITPDSFSKLHRVKSDEIFHFYLGDAVEMIKLNNDGEAETVTLGTDLLENQRPQVIVPQNTWQAAKLAAGGKFALLGCTVAPGFEFADYENGDRNELTKKFPRSKQLIEKCI